MPVEEFSQSFWGGFFYFLGGTLMVVTSFFPIRMMRGKKLHMQEFLRSHAGTFFLCLVSAAPFFLAGLGSIWHWKPGWIILGELLLALLVGVAWAVGNLPARWVLGFVFLNLLAMVAVGGGSGSARCLRRLNPYPLAAGI